MVSCESSWPLLRGQRSLHLGNRGQDGNSQYRGHRLCDVTSPCLRQCLRDCRACRRAVAVVSTADTIERRTVRHRVLTSINYRRIPLARVPRAECAAKKHASNSRRRCSSSHADEFDFVRADDVVINVISCLRGFDDQWWLHDGAVDGGGHRPLQIVARLPKFSRTLDALWSIASRKN